ncbi:MAG: hypothetical protein ACLTNP_03900 [Streptococcus salivarius]
MHQLVVPFVSSSYCAVGGESEDVIVLIHVGIGTVKLKVKGSLVT